MHQTGEEKNLHACGLILPVVLSWTLVLVGAEIVDVVAIIAKINTSSELTNRGGDCVCLHCSPTLSIVNSKEKANKRNQSKPKTQHSTAEQNKQTKKHSMTEQRNKTENRREENRIEQKRTEYNRIQQNKNKTETKNKTELMTINGIKIIYIIYT